MQKTKLWAMVMVASLMLAFSWACAVCPGSAAG